MGLEDILGSKKCTENIEKIFYDISAINKQ